MQITVNGNPEQFDGRLSVAGLLDRLTLAGRRLAVERNGEIVPRSRFDQEWLHDGDRVEIVAAVGGG